MDRQKILFFIGCDKSGKTSIATALSKETSIPYFKNPSDVLYFKKNHVDALHYEAQIMYEFLKQTKTSVIRDREFMCEYAYSKVFNRETDEEFIWLLDEQYEKLNAKIIYCFKDIYKDFKDQYVDESKIELIKEKYEEYLSKTKMLFIKLNTTDENLKDQLSKIINFIER